LYVCTVQLNIKVVQTLTSLRRVSVVVAIGLLFGALPSRAQYAFNRVPESVKSSKLEAGDTPKASAYRLVHGVVQDANGVLAGATVWLHGTRTVVVTNSEGEFELRVPITAKVVKLTCGYGGLHEEEVTMAPVQAMGSVYLLRPKAVAKN
jgi:hypothetical protein